MESQTIVKRTTRRTVVDGGDIGDSSLTKSSRSYQVYRGMSPTTSNRLEIRIRELEDALEVEREARHRAEKECGDLSFQLDSLTERLDEAEGYQTTQSDLNRKREAELIKFKKDMEMTLVQHESAEASQRKRHQEAVADLSDQVDQLTRNKQKQDKEKQTFIIEIDTLSSSLDASNKARAHAESKLDGLDDQVRRLKAQTDELTRQNGDLNNNKARLTQENFELQRQLQDLDSSNAAMAKAKSTLQASLDDMKNRLDEETRGRSLLNSQYNNLSLELDQTNASLEDLQNENETLRMNFAKAQTELGALRSRYEKELTIKTEELEDMKRRSNARIAELEDLAEQARIRASKLEKEKNRLSVELREITVELESLTNLYNDTARRLKEAEKARDDYRNRADDLAASLQEARNDRDNLAGQLANLKINLHDLEDKNSNLTRENKQLSDGLREANNLNKDLSRQVQELTNIRMSLEAERDMLAGENIDLKDALKNAEGLRDAANAALASLRSEMEHRLREKDEEIDSIRKSGQRALDELQRTIIEIETRYKTEINRLKKKYESDIREYEIQIETLSRQNDDLNKSNKKAINRVKELEMALEDERRSGEDARQAVTVLERKRIALTTELEDTRSLLEASERARKNADNELNDAATRINELTISITAFTNDKRRMESDLTSMHADLDEAINARRASDDKADRLQAENNRLNDELRIEQENYKNAEALRKQLEVEIREITVRLEEAEAFAQREGKRMITKLQGRLRDLENELEIEQRRSRELLSSNKKIERYLTEIRVQADEDSRARAELQDQNTMYMNRIKIIKRQLEEAEEVVNITMGKYRKAQTMVEEAENRADMAEKNIQLRGKNRSMSVTREVVRVVRV